MNVKHALAWESHIGSKSHRTNAARLRKEHARAGQREEEERENLKRKVREVDKAEEDKEDEDEAMLASDTKRQRIDSEEPSPTASTTAKAQQTALPADFFSNPSMVLPPLESDEDEDVHLESPNHYSLMYHEEEHEMMPTLEVSTPQSSRSATLHKKTDGYQGTYDLGFLLTLTSRINETTKKGMSMSQISLAWIMVKDSVMAPIIGTTSLLNLEDILGWLDVKLTDKEIKYLEEPYRPLMIAGHS